MRNIIFSLLASAISLPLAASTTNGYDWDNALLIPQVAYISQLKTLPNFNDSLMAFYSLDEPDYIATPMLIKSAMMGVVGLQDEVINQDIAQTTEVKDPLECQACGCYLGGLGGVAGMGAAGVGGGGSYSYSGSGFGSSSFAYGGGGGGGGFGFSNPPSSTPTNPPNPPIPPIPPIHEPEPETWLTLAGALLVACIWKWRKQKKLEKA